MEVTRRMVSDLVAGNEPVGHKGVIRIIQRDIIGHLGCTAIRIHTLSKELVDGIDGVGLDGIVGSIDEKLRDITLATSNIRNKKLKWDDDRDLS
jgi:hypothetical protein